MSELIWLVVLVLFSIALCVVNCFLDDVIYRQADQGSNQGSGIVIGSGTVIGSDIVIGSSSTA